MTPIDKERTKQSDELKLIPDKKSLVDLHARLIRSQIRAGTCDRRWRLLIENILNVEVGNLCSFVSCVCNIINILIQRLQL